VDVTWPRRKSTTRKHLESRSGKDVVSRMHVQLRKMEAAAENRAQDGMVCGLCSKKALHWLAKGVPIIQMDRPTV